MRKILNILASVMLIFATWSCSEDIMDDINKNVNDPTDVGSNLIITNTMVRTAFSITASDLAFYASIYIEHATGIWNQANNADKRTGEPISATTYNNSWNSIYQNLNALKIIIDKTSEGGSEEGNVTTLGIAQTLMAYNLAILTDLFGDVPLTEALQPGFIFAPVIDSQESVYIEVFRLLDAAIANLDQTSTFPELGTQDVIYGGNKTRWKQFAYGLKARYTMRLSLHNPDYSSVISFANQSFSSPAEQAQFNYNGSSTMSPFYRFFTDRDYLGASESLHNKLVERGDPRDTIFWMTHPAADEFLFAPNGTAREAQGLYAVSAISNATAPTYLLSYHELEFLKAEAFVRQNNIDSAAVSLERAITAAFLKDNIGLTDEDAATYFEQSVTPRFNSNPLAEVMNQKYIAFFEEEAVEAYNDYRRLVAMGNDVIELENPANDLNQFPQRFTYGSSDVTTNANVRSAYGDGTYVYSEKVWWAGGTR